MLDGKYRYIYPNKKISPRFLAGFFLFTTCEWYLSGSFLLTFLFFTCFLRVFYVPGLEFVFYEFFTETSLFFTCFLSLVFYRAYANFLNNFRFLLVSPGVTGFSRWPRWPRWQNNIKKVS